MAQQHVTRFGSLTHYEKGGVEVINDDARNYVFSNIFEVASKAKPYEKVAVGKNIEYVIEAIRAEGTSGWRARSGRVRARDGWRGRDPTVEARQPTGGARGNARVHRADRHSRRSPDGCRTRPARSHDAVTRRGRLPIPRGASRCRAPPDARRAGHGRTLGGDLPDCPAPEGLRNEEEADEFSDERCPRDRIDRAQPARLPDVHVGRLHLQP